MKITMNAISAMATLRVHRDLHRSVRVAGTIISEVLMGERSFNVVIYREGDVFVAQCLDVDVASDGATGAEARENLRQALELYFDEPGAEPRVCSVSDACVEQLILKSA
jgi:predicted RNase H-like HicB family nuclease